MYGKLISHLPRTNFNIFRSYPNREAMQHQVENKIFQVILNSGESDEEAILRIIGQSIISIKDVVIILRMDGSKKATYIFDGTDWIVTDKSYVYEPNIDIATNLYLLVDYNKDGNYAENRTIDAEIYGDNNFDLTVWQVQMIDDLPRCIAVARLHSILPTFEKCGEYHIDIFAPTSAGDYFGKGKNIYVLNANNLPIGLSE